MRVKLSGISASKTLAALKRLLAEILLRKATVAVLRYVLSLNEQNEENRQGRKCKKEMSDLNFAPLLLFNSVFTSR